MSDYSFTYRDDSFSLTRAYDAELLIKAGKAEFSFLVVSKGKIVAWKEGCAISDLSDNQDLAGVLKAPYQQITIGLLPDGLTLIPATIFTKENVGDYARFLDVAPDDKVFAAKLDNHNELVYKTDYTFINFLISQFNLPATIPADRGWITAIAKIEPSNDALYLDITGAQLTVLNYNGGSLRFYNCFKFEDVNDIIYYCLFVAHRLDLQPEHTSLIISGHITGGDFEKLSEFFRIVKYNDLKVLEVPHGVLPHQVLSLAALA